MERGLTMMRHHITMWRSKHFINFLVCMLNYQETTKNIKYWLMRRDENETTMVN